MDLERTKVVRECHTNLTISQMFASGKLRDDHPLQRRPDQHSNSYRDGFIATVIKNEDFDAFKVCEQNNANGTVTLWLIDGLQRISEIQNYKNGVFKLGRDIEFPIVQYQVTKKDSSGNIVKDVNGNPDFEIKNFDLRGKAYKDLPKELQEKFDQCPIDIVKHLDCTDEEIAYHIRRYNHEQSMNSAQTGMTYADKCAYKIKKIANNNPFFLNCGKYTANEQKKSGIERVIMQSIIATFHLDDWKSEVKKMGKFINENSTDDEFETINDYFTRLYPIAEGKYETLFNSKNTHVFVAAFDRFTKMGLPDSEFGRFLESFNDLQSVEIDGVTYAELDADRHTTNKNVVTKKIDFLEKLMKVFFDIDSENVNKNKSPEEFISAAINVNQGVIKRDMDLYEESLDDLLYNTVRDSSRLLEPENRLSLLAMVAYSYNYDVDLDEWLLEYAKNNDTYFKDQWKNFFHMLDDFKNYLTSAA